jgi:hypothetical protein
LEGLFHRIADEYKANSSCLISIEIKKLEDIRRIDSDLRGLYPRMATVNKLCLIPNVKKAIWSQLALEDCAVPGLGDNLLYGGISEKIHNPNFPAIVVSNLESPEYKSFFNMLALFLKKVKGAVEFSEELAAAYTDDGGLLSP